MLMETGTTFLILRSCCASFKSSCALTAVFVTQVERVVTIMQNPRQYKIPDWFLNRQKDVKDGKYSQVGGNSVILAFKRR